MTKNLSLAGKLLGKPFLASIDRGAVRVDRENCALVVEDYLVPPGYSAYILDASFPEEYARNLAAHCPLASVVYAVTDSDALDPFDVVDVHSDGIIHRIYLDNSDDNVLFITNKCNSNCVMCPDPDSSRRRMLGDRMSYLRKLVELIPTDSRHLTITGGEPTLLKWDLIELLDQCRLRFPKTDFLMLSNGRSFCVDSYRNAFIEAIPEQFRLAVPLYAANAAGHDEITRVDGSFAQTIAALKHLQDQLPLELRVVVMENNYRRLPEIAKYITAELPGTMTVSIMGIELLGNAAVRRDHLWVDYAITAPLIEDAVTILLNAGIDAKIYNYPLCSLPQRLWSIAVKSITPNKVRYRPECDSCLARCHCGGFFFSTVRYEKVHAIPITEEY